jgi:hypothetical protein
MSNLATPEMPTTVPEARTGRIQAVLGTLRHNKNVQKDLVITAASAVLSAALTGGNLEVAGLGGFVGSFARTGVNELWNEPARRKLAVMGRPVDRSVADGRHLVTVLVDAIKSRTVQRPKVEQMNADSIRRDREVMYSTPPTHR